MKQTIIKTLEKHIKDFTYIPHLEVADTGDEFVIIIPDNFKNQEIYEKLINNVYRDLSKKNLTDLIVFSYEDLVWMYDITDSETIKNPAYANLTVKDLKEEVASLLKEPDINNYLKDITNLLNDNINVTKTLLAY